jgi:hypothetical protein
LIGGAAPPDADILLPSRHRHRVCPQPEPSRWRGRALVSSFI